MQYLVIFTPKQKFGAEGIPEGSPALELKPELIKAQVLYKEEGLRQVWALDTESKGAVVLFEAESPEHLHTMLGAFPLVKAEDADCQILPLASYPTLTKSS